MQSYLISTRGDSRESLPLNGNDEARDLPLESRETRSPRGVRGGAEEDCPSSIIEERGFELVQHQYSYKCLCLSCTAFERAIKKDILNEENAK